LFEIRSRSPAAGPVKAALTSRRSWQWKGKRR
jgi:hypothetical protein